MHLKWWEQQGQAPWSRGMPTKAAVTPVSLESRKKEGVGMGSDNLVCVVYMDHVDSYKPLQRIWIMDEASM